MKYGIDTLDKMSFLSFYSTYSSPKLFVAVINNAYKPYFEACGLSCRNNMLPRSRESLEHFKMMTTI